MSAKLAVFFFFFAVTSFASDLDKAVSRANAELNPKKVGEIGYEVDYRQEQLGEIDTWINISAVKKVCGPRTESYLKDGKIVTTTENGCYNQMIMFDREPNGHKDLYQINCYKSRGAACIKSLAHELTPEVVNLMISKGITRVYVK